MRDFFLKHLIFVVATVAGIASLPQHSDAAIDFTYATNQSDYQVLPSGSAVVNLYLRETVSDGTPSQLVNGLFSVGVNVLRTTSPSDPASLTDASSNPGFNDNSVFTSSKSVTASDTKFQAATTGGSVASVNLGGGVREVFLGTVTVQGGLIPLQQTTFTVRDFDNHGLSEDTLTGIGQIIDTPGGIFPISSTFTVTIVPEPASLGLTLFALVLLARRRRRSLKSTLFVAQREHHPRLGLLAMY